MRRKINQKDTVFSKNSFLCGRGIRDIKVGFSPSLFSVPPFRFPVPMTGLLLLRPLPLFGEKRGGPSN